MKLYVNIDGGSRGNPGPGAAAMVVAGRDGRVLLTKSKYLGPAVTNNFAEWSALEGAVKALLHFAGIYGRVEAEIRADSELVVRQFNRSYKIRNPELKAIAGRVWEALAKNPSLRITLVHVPREENKLADAAVNRELDSRMEKERDADREPGDD
ncbi:MAG: ribonuclease HI family protein [Firmicutes bacterium]|nr:ribonuclease HI family protein [Bacillota bacterium]